MKPGVTEKESAELREARKRIRLLEQEAEVMRRAVAYLSRDVNPKCTRWSANWPPVGRDPYWPLTLVTQGAWDAVPVVVLVIGASAVLSGALAPDAQSSGTVRNKTTTLNRSAPPSPGTSPGPIRRALV